MKTTSVLPVAFSLLSTLLPSASACSHLYTKRSAYTKREGEVRFGYQGDIAPQMWPALDVESNVACGAGRSQSPIILQEGVVPPAVKEDMMLEIPHMNVTEFENLGTTIEVITKGGSIQRGGETFELAQFHFHSPSEHRINNEYYPIELHFVFESAAKGVTVMSILVDLSDDHKCSGLLSSVLKNVDQIQTEGSKTETGELDFTNLVNHFMQNEVLTYRGSLTTPPCTEGVNWLVSAVPIKIDAASYNKVKKIVKYNSRTAQNLFNLDVNS